MKRRAIRCIFLLLALTGCGTVNGAYAQTAADSVSMQATDSVGYKEYYKLPCVDDSIIVHKSTRDYSALAAEIAAGCEDDYQRLRAIYGWICEKIDYDTKFTIYSADKCFNARRGTCQAYCELFYQIAKAAGIRAEIVKGRAKDDNGYIDPGGHAWIFAYTRENRGILIDPTWGAGSVHDGQFTRNGDSWAWFAVEPEWMILSHYPNDASYQLIEQPITQQQFEKLPKVSLLAREYGLDVHNLYEKAFMDSLSLPRLAKETRIYFQIVDVPLQEKLRIGEVYNFRIKMMDNREFSIINGSIFCKNDYWTSEGDSVYSVTFMPRDTADFCIAVKSDKEENAWEAMVEWNIEPATASDWEKVSETYPLDLPEFRKMKNLNADAWGMAGIDKKLLAQLLRQQNMAELPKLYRKNADKLKIEQVPMGKMLKVGTPYVFRFRPMEADTNWAVTNNQKWYRDWTNEDGVWSIQVTPEESGRLMLLVQSPGNKSYWSCIEYEVEQ